MSCACGCAGDVWVACRADAEAVQRLLACLTQALQHLQPGPGSQGAPGQFVEVCRGTMHSVWHTFMRKANQVTLSLQG